RLVTTHSFDLARPGVIPMNVGQQQGVPSTYTLAANQLFPSLAQPAPFPLPANGSPNSGEFGPNWGDVVSVANQIGLGSRIDLNRTWTNDYPQVDPNPNSPTAHTMAAGAGPYWQAVQERQQLAGQIFNLLRALTGAGNPATATYGTPEYDALRWLAQLSVNIVAYVQYPNPVFPTSNFAPDDIMVPFNWNPNQPPPPPNGMDPKVFAVKYGWVFGTVLPRLVANEAYIQINNTQQDLQAMPPAKTASSYDINVWIELLNPFNVNKLNSRGNPTVDLTENSAARLYVPSGNYAAYRIMVAQTVDNTANPPGDNQTALRAGDNVLGTPVNVKTVVDAYAPNPPTMQTTPPSPPGQGTPQVLLLNPNNTAPPPD